MKSSRPRWFRLSMFGMLYFVQGSALAYFRNFQKPYLDGVGIDADAIGLLTSILLLPFILKIFIGMLSDRVSLFGMGHRKPYMLLGLVLAAIAFGAAGWGSPGVNYLLFAVLVVAGSFSVTLFDSTTDGYAIDTTPRDEQGAVQGTMVGGRAMGFIILSLLFGTLVQAQSYRIIFLIIAVTMLIPILWIVWVREPAERSIETQFDWCAFRALIAPRFLIFALYAIVYSIASFGADGLVTFHMSQTFDAPEVSLGTYGALRGVGAVIGALGGGLLVDRLGRRPSAYAAAIAIALGAALLGFAPSIGMLLILGVIWGLFWGFQETIFVALAMDISDVRIAASMFALMMAFSNVGTAIGEGIATGLTDNIGFAPVFFILAGISVLTLPVLWGLFRIAPDVASRSIET